MNNATDDEEVTEMIHQKLEDALTPGFQAAFSSIEAKMAGAFFEDAITEKEALETDIEMLEITKSEEEKSHV